MSVSRKANIFIEMTILQKITLILLLVFINFYTEQAIKRILPQKVVKHPLENSNTLLIKKKNLFPLSKNNTSPAVVLMAKDILGLFKSAMQAAGIECA